MGLFTGETVLHIAIAKRRIFGLRLLLENDCNLACRTTGQFFAPDRVMPFRRHRSRAISFLDSLLSRVPTFHTNDESTREFLEPAISEERYTFTELMAATSYTQMWNGGYPLLQNPMSGFYGGELPLSFAASMDDTRVMTKLLDNLKRRVWRDLDALQAAPDRQTAHRTKRKNKRFLLTVNPAWSHAMAADEVEQRQLQDAWQSTRSSFINAKDSFGNTALHLAVIHNRSVQCCVPSRGDVKLMHTHQTRWGAERML